MAVGGLALCGVKTLSLNDGRDGVTVVRSPLRPSVRPPIQMFCLVPLTEKADSGRQPTDSLPDSRADRVKQRQLQRGGVGRGHHLRRHRRSSHLFRPFPAARIVIPRCAEPQHCS